MGKRQIAAQQTRQKLIDAAGKLIAEKGFEPVSVADIAAKAGVAKGSFYTYFKRKEDVVAEIAYEKYAAIEARAKATGDLCAQLSAFLRESMRYIADAGVHICQQWLKNTMEPEDRQGKDKLRYDTGVIRDLLTAAVLRGELGETAPVETLADQIAAAYYGMVTLWAVTNGGFDPVRHMEQYGLEVLPAILKEFQSKGTKYENTEVYPMKTTVTLNNGIEMPLVGLGTFLMSPADAEEAVVNALAAGYRLIDTANAYMNECAVGRGMKRSGLKREEIFLEFKLWPTVYTRESAVDEMLARLDTDYVDLLLIHQPAGDYIAGWRALEKAYKDGKAKSIGLSNFEGEPLEEILKICEIKPAVIQVEAHPYYPQNDLRTRISASGIHIQAWYPLGHGDKNLVNEPLFSELAAKYGKSNAQIILHWHVQSGNVVIPGSKNPAHIRDNADIFDFALTDDEMNAIAGLDKNTRYYVPDPELLKAYAAMELQPGADV